MSRQNAPLPQAGDHRQAPECHQPPVHRWRWLVLPLVAIVVLVITLSWLLVVFFPGRDSLARARSREVRQSTTIATFLTRTVEPTDDIDVDVVYGTAEYFRVVDSAGNAARFAPSQYLVFVQTETSHVRSLPVNPSQPQLRVAGRAYAPADHEVLADSTHHRTTVWRFNRTDARGEAVVPGGAAAIELVYANDQAAVWELPIEYPPEILNQNRISLALILAAVAGLLTVISPCLLQMTGFFLSMMTSVTLEEAMNEGISRAAQRTLVKTSIFFVLGFSAVYMLAGAVAGYLGHQIYEFLGKWDSLLATLAGLAVIVMGIWMGIRSRAALLCKIPLPMRPRKRTVRGFWGPLFMGLGYGFGCATCFGGALLGTLLIYVGANASAWNGALILLGFSLAVSVPFVLASIFISRAMPLIRYLDKAAPYLALASSLVMILVGVLLFTEQVHFISDLIFRYLPLQ